MPLFLIPAVAACLIGQVLEVSDPDPGPSVKLGATIADDAAGLAAWSRRAAGPIKAGEKIEVGSLAFGTRCRLVRMDEATFVEKDGPHVRPVCIVRVLDGPLAGELGAVAAHYTRVVDGPSDVTLSEPAATPGFEPYDAILGAEMGPRPIPTFVASTGPAILACMRRQLDAMEANRREPIAYGCAAVGYHVKARVVGESRAAATRLGLVVEVLEGVGKGRRFVVMEQFVRASTP